MKTVGREILWNLPHQATVVLYSLLGVLLLLFAWGVCSRVRFYRRGRPEGENRLDRPWERIRDLLRIGLCQKRVLEKKPGGPIHLAIYASFIALFFVTCIVALEHDFGVKGKVVTNPSGGLLSKGHSLGATGLAQCAELVWQLRGQAGARQVEGAKYALQHNLGLGGACIVTLYSTT